MSNQYTNSDDVFEQYVDASVALFMKYYCDTLYQDVINRDVNTEENAGSVFPAELDARCRSLIKKAVKRQRLRENARITGKVLRRVFSFMIICMAISCFLFVSVEAIRVPIINYYIEHSENNLLEIGGYDNSVGEALEDDFDASDPLRGLIPNEYAPTTQEVYSMYNFYILYENLDKDSVFIMGRPITNVLDIDIEDADEVQRFQIYNCNAYMVVEDSSVCLVWIHEEISTTFTLIIDGDNNLDAVYIADQIIRKVS